MPVQTPLPTNYLKNNETDRANNREQSGNSEAFHCRTIATGKVGPFITDEELREQYGDAAELIIDSLDRKVETQKRANGSRDREAVGHAICARFNHEQR